MFISVNQFERDMGVDKAIGRFFVDRKPPENNSFWKGRYIYVAFGNGYISIPVYYDILHRIGLPADVLLNERHIHFMEQLMHYAILQEKNEITKPEELRAIRSMLRERIRHDAYYNALNDYFDQTELKPKGPFGLPYRSLNRADVFLYVLCDLPLSDEQWRLAIRYWYALHPTYLIMDDIRDYSKDKDEGEDNVVTDLGDGLDGFEKAFEMMKENSAVMAEINPVLAEFLLCDEEELRKFIPVNI